jgi:hypothetical protein
MPKIEVCYRIADVILGTRSTEAFDDFPFSEAEISKGPLEKVPQSLLHADIRTRN